MTRIGPSSATFDSGRNSEGTLAGQRLFFLAEAGVDQTEQGVPRRIVGAFLDRAKSNVQGLGIRRGHQSIDLPGEKSFWERCTGLTVKICQQRPLPSPE
jgi:hypothetical protein